MSEGKEKKRKGEEDDVVQVVNGREKEGREKVRKGEEDDVL